MFRRMSAAVAFVAGVYLMAVEGADWGIVMVVAGVIIHLSGKGSFGVEDSLSEYSMSDWGDGDGGSGDGGGGD